MKIIICYLFPTFLLLFIMQNAQAGFLVKKTTATETLVSTQSNAIIKSEQKIWHTGSQLKQVFKHPKIQFFSQSNGYKALMCGLIGLVIFPIGIKAISYKLCKCRVAWRQKRNNDGQCW